MRSSSCGLYFSALSFNGPSNHPGVAFKFINRISLSISRQNIFIKTLILVKIASHIGCNRRQDRNFIIIFWIHETLFFQRPTLQFRLTPGFNHNNCAAILYFWCGIHRTEKEMDGTRVKWNTFFTDKHFPPKFSEFSGIVWLMENARCVYLLSYLSRNTVNCLL